MICGIDVYHAGTGEGVRASVAGFVASLDRLATKWFSKVCMQGPHQELVDLLQVCLLSAINAYYKVTPHWCQILYGVLKKKIDYRKTANIQIESLYTVMELETANST